MKLATISVLLFICFVSCSGDNYDEEAWKEAAKFLQQGNM